jgi:hypothetical protein
MASRGVKRIEGRLRYRSSGSLGAESNAATTRRRPDFQVNMELWLVTSKSHHCEELWNPMKSPKLKAGTKGQYSDR